MRLRSRLLAVTAAVTACAFGGAPGAAAQSEPIVGVCPFPITHDFPFVNAKTHEFFDKPTPFEVIETGAVTVVVTNLENGKSVRVHSNAPTFYSAGGGSSGYFRGQGTVFFNSARGEIPQGAWLTAGNWFLTFDIETGRVITASGGILRRDICAELA